MTITVNLEVISILLSLACAVAVFRSIRSKNRRYKSMLEYIDKCDIKQRADFEKMLREEIRSASFDISREKEEIEKQIRELAEKVDSGLSDINPNFEAARKAMGQVNDMAMGLSNLFNFDPVDSLKRSRGDAE